MMRSMPSESPLVHRARELARVAHADHTRKAGDVPYFTHLEAVAELVMRHGSTDPHQVAAAYLHDLLEDRPVYAERFRAELPTEVVAIVEVLTEPKRDRSGRQRDKGARFADYAAQLQAQSAAARVAIPISCADKIHNVRSLVEAERGGDSLLLRLSTRPGQHEAQLGTLRPIYAAVVPESMLEAFDRAVEELLKLIAAWLPGRAVMVAAEAHLGQVDKGGAPYIDHPLRVMSGARTSDERMTALLHDVVEDSPWTLEALRREGFPARVISALDHLTRRGGEDYAEFIERASRDPIARAVKLLDLQDNMDLDRIAEPTDRDRARVARYQKAIARLRDA